MSGELNFIDLDGVEIANAYRTLQYLRNGLGGVKWQVPEVYPCSVLAREVGGIGPFVSPSADPAPWYDSSIPESAQFLGFISRLDFQTITTKRNTTQRFGSIGGGVIGIEQFAVRNLHVDGMLIASSCPGLEYGRHWLYGKLGSDCLGCGLRIVRVRESCPPSDGSNDTRGERIMYDSALISGIERNDNGGAMCCDYDGIAFDIASQSPYLYSRVGTATSPVSTQTSGNMASPSPAVLDTGTRANTGPPPSANWTGPAVSGYGNNLKIISNAFAITVGAIAGSAYWNPASYGPDCAASFTLSTRGDVFGSRVTLFARLTTPGAGTGTGVFASIQFGAAGADFCTLGRIRPDGSTPLVFGLVNQTWVVGDTFMLTARGYLVELWRLPSGGAWVHLGSYYDSTLPVSGRVGLGITEAGTSPAVANFGGGTLTNGVYPLDIQTLAIPATSIGIVSPIVTVTAPTVALAAAQVSVNDMRIQLKTGSVDCFQSDDFAVDDLAARWTQQPAASWQITGGKLRPTATGLSGGIGRRIHRSKDSQGKTITMYGGKVQADVKLGTTIANGAWGVLFGTSPFSGGAYGAFLTQNISGVTNAFVLNVDANGGTVLDTVPFTPVAGTTYRIIYEVLPLGAGSYDIRGYLVNPTTNQMLTRPLRATTSAINSPTMNPAIGTIPRDTADEWDNFYAVDYSDSPDFLEASLPGGTLVIDASRRVTKFTPSGSLTSQDGSAYVTSPIDAPLGWTDLCAGQGPACLQYWSSESVRSGSTTSVALQQRQR